MNFYTISISIYIHTQFKKQNTTKHNIKDPEKRN